MGMTIEDLPRTILVDERKPFHQVVGDLICRANWDQMRILERLLTTAIIPGGHEEITSDWIKRCKELKFPSEYLAEGILRHKQEMEKAVVKASEDLIQGVEDSVANSLYET